MRACPGQICDIDVGNAGEFPFGFARGPTYDFDRGKVFAAGKVDDLSQSEFRENGGYKAKLHGDGMVEVSVGDGGRSSRRLPDILPCPRL